MDRLLRRVAQAQAQKHLAALAYFTNPTPDNDRAYTVAQARYHALVEALEDVA